MKRLLLSGIVIASFIIFSLYYRVMGESTSLTAVPKTQPKNWLGSEELDEIPTQSPRLSSIIQSLFIPDPTLAPHKVQSLTIQNNPTATPIPHATPTPIPKATPTTKPVSINGPTPTNTPFATSTPIPTNTPFPTSTPIPTNTPTPVPSGYRDGTYIGDAADAFYGLVQVQVTLSNGQITNVQFLQYPNDQQHSIMINQQAMPILTQEAIQAQSAQVDIVSGATDTSQAFIQSLQTALNKAKI